MIDRPRRDMGVRGLLTYLKKHPEGRCRSVHLSAVAREARCKAGKTPKLLCDFTNVFVWISSEFHEAKVKCKDYQNYSYIYGGNLVDYEKRFIAFVRALRHNEVDPVFFVDGKKGSDLRGFLAKLETHRKRHERKIERNYILGQVTKYDPKQEVKSYAEAWTRPPLLTLHILMALKSEGVVLEYCVGEADACMAQYAQTAQGDVCGILTNDTDMVVMRKCEVFLCAFFDREAKLGIREPIFNDKPIDIVCEKVTPCTVARVLHIPENDLKNLSIICGNDYTGGLNFEYQLIKKMKLNRPIVESAARWLRETPHLPLHETSPLKEVCEESGGKYKQAIDHTYHAYGEGSSIVEASPDENHQNIINSPLYSMILSEVRKGKMVRDLLPMAANSIHWRDSVVEIDQPERMDHPPANCINDLLLPIRQLIYKLLGLQTVTEYGRTGKLSYSEIPVQVHNPDSSLLLPQFRERAELEKVCLLSTFLARASILKESLADFQEPLKQATLNISDTVHQALLKTLPLCATLLFSYDLRGVSRTFCHDLVPDVFLITGCMCCLGLPPRKVHSRPSPEAINVATGFACIIKHSYYLASLLGLMEVMPFPGRMYQVAALIPLFYVATCKPSTIKHQLKANKEMAETHHAYQYITHQLPSFEKLKELLEEVYRSFKSSCGLILPSTILSLAATFMEVMADIDEADKRDQLFVTVQVPLVATHPPRRQKGQRMSLLLSIINFVTVVHIK